MGQKKTDRVSNRPATGAPLSAPAMSELRDAKFFGMNLHGFLPDWRYHYHAGPEDSSRDLYAAPPS